MLGLLRHELPRLLTRTRLYVAVAAMFILGAATILGGRSELATGAGLTGVVPYSGSMLFLRAIAQSEMLLFIWPLVAAGTVAEDLQTNLASLLLVRAGSWRAWLGAKLLAALLVSFGAVGALGIGWAAVAALSAPWDPTNASIVVSTARDLATRAPLAHGFMSLAVLALGATATSVVSMLLGASGATTNTSQIGAAVIFAASAFVLPRVVNPAGRAVFASVYEPWSTLPSTLLYWAGVFGILIAATYLTLRRKEAR